MKTALLIVLLALSSSAYAATIPAYATKSLAALKSHNLPALKKSYEVVEKLLLGNRSPLTTEEAESLKALTTLKADLDPDSEEYFLANIIQGIVGWAVQWGLRRGVGYMLNEG